MLILSVFYSSNLSEAQYSIEKRVPYLVFPLVLGTIPHLDQQRIRDLLRWTAHVCIFSILVDLSIASYHFMHEKNLDVFFWENLAKEFTFHPSYLSIFVLFNLSFLFLDFYLSDRKSKIFFSLKIIFLSVSIILLSSKLFVVLLFALLVIFSFLFIKDKKKKVLLFILLVASFIVTLRSAYIKERFNSIKSMHYKLDDPVENFNELTIRFALIDCSLDIISKNILFGVGTGDTADELDKTYRKYDYKFGYLDKQNPHNQYLNILIPTGLFGFVIFMISLLAPLYYSVKRRNYLYTIFLLMFMISFLVESTLERQKGIVMFYLFGSLLLFHPYVIARSSGRNVVTA